MPKFDSKAKTFEPGCAHSAWKRTTGSNLSTAFNYNLEPHCAV